MRSLYKATSTLFMIILLIFVVNNSLLSQTPDTLQVHYDVYQCDSLIQANSINPDFVILDVRTPGEHIPQHLSGAIMRNYYNANFTQLLDTLPRHKFYLIHCASGGRSGNTFNMMVAMDFPKVVNMMGGINAWNIASLPTTSAFAPMLMSVSETIIPNEDVIIGDSDSIFLTITNRANDTLSFNSISNLSGTEFSTDFDTTTILIGAQDYSFSITYEPIDNNNDSIDFMIFSNGGEVNFRINRSGLLPVGISEPSYFSNILIYPNPARERIFIDISELNNELNTIITIHNLNGQEVCKQKAVQASSRYEFDISSLSNGIYLLSVYSSGNNFWQEKLIVN